MAVPKKKSSKSKRGMRRSHTENHSKNLFAFCTTCNQPKMLHRINKSCPYCLLSRSPYKDQEN